MLLDYFDTSHVDRLTLKNCAHWEASGSIYSLGEISEIWVLLRYPNLKPPGYPC
jgi:hypothetical protein